MEQIIVDLKSILNKTITKIQKYLDDYRKIIIFDCRNENIQELAHKILKHLPEYECTYKEVLILLVDKQWEDVILPNGMPCNQITNEEFECFLELYNMYEFSDRITLVSESVRYPGMINYLTGGLLTEGEWIDALLH